MLVEFGRPTWFGVNAMDVNAIVAPWGGTCVYAAVEYGRLDILAYLAEDVGADVDKQGDRGVSPLFLAAQRNMTAAVDVLLRAGQGSKRVRNSQL